MTGGSITVFEFGLDSVGNVVTCSQDAAAAIQHELGHVLGLADVAYQECFGHVMGSHYFGQMTAIYADDCDEADALWWTSTEEAAREANDQCNLTCPTNCYNAQCDSDSCFQYPDGHSSSYCRMSPILVDLDRNDFHLTSLAGGVWFDLDADGISEHVSWTRGAERDAFLCMDRNGNGRIDDGSELFGNHTRLSNGHAALNGYEALRESDSEAARGNGDGVLSPADAVWTRLQLWIDTNHDGISQSQELQPLSAAGVVSLEIMPVEAARRDAYGNAFRYRASASLANRQGHPSTAITYDVFFVTP